MNIERYLTVNNCSSCGKDHEEIIVFVKDNFFECPSTGERVYFQYVPDYVQKGWDAYLKKNGQLPKGVW